MRTCVLLALVVAAGGPAAGEGIEALSPAEREALEYFTPEDIARGRTRARQSVTLWFAGLVWGVIVLAALAHPKVSGAVMSLSRRTLGAVGTTTLSARRGAGDQASPLSTSLSTPRALGVAALAVAATLAIHLVARMPFAWARGYLLEHAWGLSKQTAGAFFLDWLKGFAVSIVLSCAALVIVVSLRSALPTWWPAAAWGATSALIVLYVFLMPIVVDPLFAEFTPVSEPEVLERVNSVARKAGLSVGEVLWSDASKRTRRTNAYFTGLGATKRIVLYDTLKGEVGPDGRIRPDKLDEMEVILAHEAGHWRRGHMWKGTLLGLVGVGGFFVALWLLFMLGARTGWSWVPPASLPDGARAAALVFLLATVLSFLSMPFECAITRVMERGADSDSLEFTGKREAYVRSQVELARRNVSNITPSGIAVFWFYTHPPVLERIRMAEESGPAKQESPP